jgi:hypothetical protein
MIRKTTSVVLSLSDGRDLFAAYLTEGYRVLSESPIKATVANGEHHAIFRFDERQQIATVSNGIQGA